MRIPIAAANWKMFKTIGEARAFVAQLRPLIDGIDGVGIVIAPPFTAIRAVADEAAGSGVVVAGQDLFWEAQGAFTGEVSAAMIVDAGARMVIVGHSERRTKFGETDDTVNRKVRAAVAGGLTPIVCIGETLAERERNETFAVLERQVRLGLAGLLPRQVGDLVVAYEPVWAIGTGRNATPEQAQEAHAFIRGQVAGLAGDAAAASVRILYGGSMKPENVAELAARPDVDGGLIGGASLDAATFAAMVARIGGKPV